MGTDVSARDELARRGIRGVPAFLIGNDVVVGLDTAKIESLIDYSIINCTNCSAKLRVPKRSGKLMVTCPKCKTEFIVNSFS